MFEMTIKTETASGTKIERVACYDEDAVTDERNHQRTLAPRGSTQTITVKALKR